MPYLQVNGASLYYEEHGAGPATMVFAHGLLWSGRMFDEQVSVFKDRYRCITFDFRGQGQSEVTTGGYDMDTLAADAVALIEGLGAAPCHFLGLSMGGFIGMRLAIRYPALIRSLVLLETSADPEPAENVGRYLRLSRIGRWLGFSLIATPVMQIMFGAKFLRDPTRTASRAIWRQRLIANDRAGIARAVAGVVSRQGVQDQIGQIARPTLVIVGDQDVATVPAKAERIQARIPGSQLTVIAGAGHSATIEEPAAVNAAIAAFLSGLD